MIVKNPALANKTLIVHEEVHPSNKITLDHEGKVELTHDQATALLTVPGFTEHVEEKEQEQKVPQEPKTPAEAKAAAAAKGGKKGKATDEPKTPAEETVQE
jgi:hypothetical protein